MTNVTSITKFKSDKALTAEFTSPYRKPLYVDYDIGTIGSKEVKDYIPNRLATIRASIAKMERLIDLIKEGQ